MNDLEGPTATTDRGLDELADLLDRAAAGDPDAAARACDRVAGPVYRLVFSVVGRGDLTESVCHDVFREVWTTALTRSPLQAPALGWVLTLAHRRATERVQEQGEPRRTAPAAPEVLDRAAIELACFGGLTDAEVLASEALGDGGGLDRLRAALRRLPGRLEGRRGAMGA